MSPARSEAVVALGKQLVLQLGAEDDILAAWMAHHIADLIARAEAATSEDKAAADEACAAAILELWRHRNVLPEHLRPLDELQPILRTLAFLDLDPTDHRYYPTPMRAAATGGVEGEPKRLLEVAMGIDYTARVLIRMFLKYAVSAAADGAGAWVDLAAAAAPDESSAEQKLLALITSEDGAETPGFASARAALEDRLSRLEAFAESAAAAASDLRKALDDSAGPTTTD